MVASDEGDEGAGGDGGVVESKTGKAREEIGMGEESVAAVEDLDAFSVDLGACGEDGGVEGWIAERTVGGWSGEEEEVVVYLIADFTWDGEDGGRLRHAGCCWFEEV